eukprot:scaffold169666_cov24-Prasinocladus_malaysianus.AAC.1
MACTLLGLNYGAALKWSTSLHKEIWTPELLWMSSGPVLLQELMPEEALADTVGFANPDSCGQLAQRAVREYSIKGEY